MTFVDAAVHVFEASSYDSANESETEHREDQQVILVAVDIDDELFTNPGDWFHLPKDETDRENIHYHHGNDNGGKKRRTSFSRNIFNSNDAGVKINTISGEIDQYLCLSNTFLYVIASDKENANEIQRISFNMWKKIKTEVLERREHLTSHRSMINLVNN